MALYTFYCDKCDKTFDIISKPNQDQYCPICKSKLTKQFIPVNINFKLKGSGFYGSGSMGKK